MFGNVKKVIFFVLIVLLSFSIMSCGEEKATFSIPGSVDDGEYMVFSVPSSTDSIDLTEYMAVNQKSKVKFYSSDEMKDEIDSNVSLETGENLFYVKVKQGLTKKTYKIKIIKKQLLTVSFDANGGTECSQISVDSGFAINSPTTSRIGYDFVGWGYDFSLPITSDLQLVAEWTPKKYNITSDDFDNVVIDYDANYSLPEVSKLGYKFIKWVDEAGNDFPTNGIWKFTNDVSVNAVYEKEIYTITYVYGAGLGNKQSTYSVDNNVTLETPQAPDGLNFLGWFSNLDDQTTVTHILEGTTGNKTFYAKWIADEEIEHTITIDAKGSDIDGREISVFFGSKYDLPKINSRNGYEFAWKIGNEVIEQSGIWALKDDAIVSLVWTPVEYTISYVIDQKTTNPNQTTKFNIETETITLLNPTRPNAIFVGWFTKADFASDSLVQKIEKGTMKNVTLYAKFDITYYTITFDANGSSATLEPKKYELGDQYELPDITFAGRKLLGWYIDINDNSTLVQNSGIWSMEKNITLVAKWEYENYTITLSSNGETETINYTVEDTVTLPAKTLSGFVFMGWQEEGKSEVYQHVVINKGTSGNKKFTAVFSRFEYSYDSATKTATVSRYLRTKGVTSVIIPEKVNYNGIEYTVTSIGAEVFMDMGGFLATYANSFAVEIPKTLKTIGKNAFKNCVEVSINIVWDSDEDLNAWADSLIVETGNDEVIDVIKGLRPAIGWSIYA